MSFKEVRLNPDISYGAVSGPEYKTSIQRLPSGLEVRRGWHSQGIKKFVISKNTLSSEEIEELEIFFRAMRGMLNGFRYRDWNSYLKVDEPLPLLTNTTAQLQFKYTEPVTNTVEIQKVLKPVLAANVQADSSNRYYSPDISLKRNGSAFSASNYTLDRSTGIITFNSSQAGNTFTWSGSYDWPVRFDTDSMQYSQPDFDMHDWADIPLIELK